MASSGKKIIRTLKDFLAKLRSNEPIEVTEVRRIETPDGPMHVRRKKVLGEQGIDEETDDGIPDVLP